jgi:2-phosphosulfolactate phosphatase
MNINQLTGIENAKNAIGLTVVIDIMRAATVEAYAFGQGAKEIIPVATKEEAFTIKNNTPEILLMGEEMGIKIKDFDFGNSPSEIVKHDLKGKRLVQRTSSGTQGLVNATNASELIFGSFVTCSAIVKYIKNKNPDQISIVSIDHEDIIFAKYLEDSLRDLPTDKENIRKELRNDSGTDWFRDPKKLEFPLGDIELALNFDKFNFVCCVKKQTNNLLTTPIYV